MKLTLESIEVPFFRRLDEQFFDDLFHRFDCVRASVEVGGDNVRRESHKFDADTKTKRRLAAL